MDEVTSRGHGSTRAVQSVVDGVIRRLRLMGGDFQAGSCPGRPLADEPLPVRTGRPPAVSIARVGQLFVWGPWGIDRKQATPTRGIYYAVWLLSIGVK